jgi:hypothetical protein
MRRQKSRTRKNSREKMVKDLKPHGFMALEVSKEINIKMKSELIEFTV